MATFPLTETAFALVDVFTRVPLSGNPLAVVPDAQALDECLFPRIAREFNQSETTFILPPTATGADYRLRSFTPTGVEVFGAGHNALGAWWWLAASARLALAAPRTEFRQQLGDQVLPLSIQAPSGQLLTIELEQRPPEFGAIVADRQSLATALGLPYEALLVDDLPAQVVSTGAPHLMVPVVAASLHAVQASADRLRDVVRSVGGQGCYVFAPTPGGPTAATARFFNPVAGIPEDPATGSAAGSLACYLRRHGLTDGECVRVAQGAETGRPSELEVRLRGATVRLCGSGVVVATGVLRLPTSRELTGASPSLA